MAPRKKNPIAEKLLQLISSGKNISVPAMKIKVSKEAICVLSDLKYPTLENVFYRSELSYATLKSLKFAGLVTDKEEAEYRKWVLDNSPKRKKKIEFEIEEDLDVDEEAGDSFDQPEEQADGTEDNNESEVLDTGDAIEPDKFFSEE